MKGFLNKYVKEHPLYENGNLFKVVLTLDNLGAYKVKPDEQSSESKDGKECHTITLSDKTFSKTPQERHNIFISPSREGLIRASLHDMQGTELKSVEFDLNSVFFSGLNTGGILEQVVVTFLAKYYYLNIEGCVRLEMNDDPRLRISSSGYPTVNALVVERSK